MGCYYYIAQSPIMLHNFTPVIFADILLLESTMSKLLKSQTINIVMSFRDICLQHLNRLERMENSQQ